MGRDDEFSEYVASRWTRLVRSAVLLGCSPAEAEDVAQTALTKCLVHWSKVQRADDRDAYVHRVLVNTFTSERPRLLAGGRPVAVLPDHGTPARTHAEAHADPMQRSLARLRP